MRDFHFDPFGEALNEGLRTESQPSRGSALALRFGTGVFWSLVAVIVAARIAYFNPDVASSFVTLAANCVRHLV